MSDTLGEQSGQQGKLPPTRQFGFIPVECIKGPGHVVCTDAATCCHMTSTLSGIFMNERNAHSYKVRDIHTLLTGSRYRRRIQPSNSDTHDETEHRRCGLSKLWIFWSGFSYNEMC